MIVAIHSFTLDTPIALRIRWTQRYKHHIFGLFRTSYIVWIRCTVIFPRRRVLSTVDSGLTNLIHDRYWILSKRHIFGLFRTSYIVWIRCTSCNWWLVGANCRQGCAELLVFISHYSGQEISQLDHCLLWITLATTLVHPTVDRWLVGANCRQGCAELLVFWISQIYGA